LRVGNYRVFYEIDEEQKIVFVTEILTAEQAHKKYRHLD
jgi:mRNA interferase RelE/StbE